MRGLSLLRRKPPISGAEWGDEHFRLPAASSQLKGRWVTQPTQVAVLNMMCNDAIRELSVQKSARWGFTKCAVVAVLYMTEHRRRSGVIYQPNDDKAKGFVADELDPVIREMPVIQEIFPDWETENKNNTVKRKAGIGWILDILGAATAANFDRITKQFLFGDELDRWPLEAGKSGDPIKAAWSRLEGAPFPKAIFGGTPTTKDASHIERLIASASAVFRCYVPCPHCAHEQPLRWGGRKAGFGIDWDKSKTAEELTSRDVWYECEQCHGKFFYGELAKIERNARWIADDSGIWTRDGQKFYTRTGNHASAPRKCGIYINALYSLTLTDGWYGLVREWLEAQGDPLKLKTFTNLVLGELWEDESGETLDHEVLYARREVYAAPVPMGGLYLTCFIDTQDDRFEGMMVAWGVGEESWTIDYFTLYGNLHQPEVWDQLETKIRTARYRHAGGFDMNIRRFGIDTGGHFTSQAHAFVRRFPEHYGIACRGSNQYEQPVVMYSKKRNKHGTLPCVIGTDSAKDVVYGRYKVLPPVDEDGVTIGPDEPSPGQMHWPRAEWCTRAFFQQAIAEVKKLTYVKGKKVYRYEPRTKGARNEVLDCYAGNLAMVRLANLYFGLDLLLLKKNLDAVINGSADTTAKPQKKRKKVTGGI